MWYIDIKRMYILLQFFMTKNLYKRKWLQLLKINQSQPPNLKVELPSILSIPVFLPNIQNPIQHFIPPFYEKT